MISPRDSMSKTQQENTITNHSHVSAKRGIFFILLAMFTFSVLNAIIKDTVVQYPPIQLVFFRCFFAIFPAGLMILMRQRWVLPSRQDWKIHIKRALLLSIGLSCLFFGIGQLPLSNSMALYFSSTLFLVLLSYPILKEKISIIQGIAVGIGFLGVLIIAKPEGNVFQWGALFVILGAFMESAYNLLGRLLSSSYDSFMLTFLGSLLPACVALLALPFVWVMPSWEGWIALIFLGLGGGLGQLCVTFAYYHAPAGILAPMIYSAMIWSVMFDVILYGNWPTQTLILGCGIIIAAGLMIIFSERKPIKAG